MLFSEVKRSDIIAMVPYSLERYSDVFLNDQNIIIWFFLRNLQLSSEIFGTIRNFWKMSENDCLAFRQLLENLQKSLESVWTYPQKIIKKVVISMFIK